MNSNRILIELEQYFSTNAINLGNRGWFTTSQMGQSDLSTYRELIKTSEFKKLDDILMIEIESTFEEILTDLVEKHPQRAPAIKQACKAHKNEEYFLSVPVFLIQTDGIFLDYFGGSLFMGKNRAEVLKNEKAVQQYPSSFLTMLQAALPVYESEKERRNVSPWTELNRHLVLHGESTDYGTKLNSLKAFSLLSYVSNSFGCVAK